MKYKLLSVASVVAINIVLVKCQIKDKVYNEPLPPIVPGVSGPEERRKELYKLDPMFATMEEKDTDPNYILTEEDLKKIREPLLYPFTDRGKEESSKHGDLSTEISSHSSQINKQFGFLLPFYGFGFNYTRLSLNGYLGFSDVPDNLDPGMNFPNPNWPNSPDPSFIGPFFSECKIGELKGDELDVRQPGVYFRLERTLGDRGQATKLRKQLYERLKWDIREGIVGAEIFDPKHVLIATWKNISFAGGNYNTARRVTNTFQVVLASDEIRSYAMFNYKDIQWTSHTIAGGDFNTGQGGIPAYIGFNAGNGTRAYSYKPYSRESYIWSIASSGMVNGKPGRHIFRIDETILPGACTQLLGTSMGNNLKLVFSPEYGNMLGGNIVNVTGPCFKAKQRVTCRFHTVTVEGVVVDQNRAVCVQPQVPAVGWVDIAVSQDGGPELWKGKYFLESPMYTQEMVWFGDDAYREAKPGHIRIKWNKHNLTMDDSAQVSISLWGYREASSNPELVYIDMLAESTSNDGDQDFATQDFYNRDNWKHIDVDVGLIQINITNPLPYWNFKKSPNLWSRPIPLAWYFAEQWRRAYGNDWAKERCSRWIENDRNLKNFAADVVHCPCKLTQALNSRGMYLPEPECDMFGNTNCYYNQGAVHCVRTATPTKDGSGQKCCYDRDGYLMMTTDQLWGGTPMRSHDYGLLPYNEAGKVPGLSHWLHDVAPMYMCCLWQTDMSGNCLTYRFERRASQDCVGFQPPGAATVFGDPHVHTFDNVQYTFNGKGEFVLVRAKTPKLSSSLDVQGRFEQVSNHAWGETRATQLTGVAARTNISSVVQVSLRPEVAQWRYRLDIYVDGNPVYFDRYSQRVQPFTGLTVYVPSNVHNQSQVFIMFQDGAGVEVVESWGHMACRVYVPMTFVNQTRGLFGNWSYDPTDDFVLPDGTDGPAEDTNSLELIHNEFGMKWVVDDKDDPYKGRSLFFHKSGRASTSFYDRAFKPEFEKYPQVPANRSILLSMQTVRDTCGDSYQCMYDYVLSMRRDFAYYTKLYQDNFVNIKADGLKKIISCGALQTPMFGRKTTFSFTPGVEVKFECDPGYILIGEKRRWCYVSGDWNWAEDGEADCIPESLFVLMQAGITTGIVLSILIPCLIAGACFCVNVRQQHRADDYETAYPKRANDVYYSKDGGVRVEREMKPMEDMPGKETST